MSETESIEVAEHCVEAEAEIKEAEDVKSEAEVELEVDPEADKKSEAEAELKAESEADKKSEAEAELKEESEADKKPEAEAELGVEPEAETKSEAEVKLKAEPEADKQFKAEIKEAKAEAEEGEEEEEEEESVEPQAEAKNSEIHTESKKNSEEEAVELIAVEDPEDPKETKNENKIDKTAPVECADLLGSQKMDDIVSDQFDALKLEQNVDELHSHHHVAQNNNENESSSQPEEKKTITSTVKSGIRAPTTVLRYPTKASPVKTPETRPSTTPAESNRTIPKRAAAPPPRAHSRMSRERSDVAPPSSTPQRSTSTRSIDNAGRFTPKVNAKFVNVKSKVGSMTNHKPGGGKVEIFSERKEYKAQSRVGSLANANHTPGGGNVKIENRKIDFSYTSPKVGSKTDYKPIKSDVKIHSEKLQWNAKSKVGSMENANHKPSGGNVQPQTFIASSEAVPIQRPVVIHVLTRPKMASTLIEKKGGTKRRSMSQRSSSGSLMGTRKYPGAIYPLTPEAVFGKF